MSKVGLLNAAAASAKETVLAGELYELIPPPTGPELGGRAATLRLKVWPFGGTLRWGRRQTTTEAVGPSDPASGHLRECRLTHSDIPAAGRGATTTRGPSAARSLRLPAVGSRRDRSAFRNAPTA